jgi:hypothetical protein
VTSWLDIGKPVVCRELTSLFFNSPLTYISGNSQPLHVVNHAKNVRAQKSSAIFKSLALSVLNEDDNASMSTIRKRPFLGRVLVIPSVLLRMSHLRCLRFLCWKMRVTPACAPLPPPLPCLNPPWRWASGIHIPNPSSFILALHRHTGR